MNSGGNEDKAIYNKLGLYFLRAIPVLVVLIQPFILHIHFIGFVVFCYSR